MPNSRAAMQGGTYDPRSGGDQPGPRRVGVAVPRSWITARHVAAIAVVVAIGALFAWRELGDDRSPAIIEAEAALQVKIGEPVPDFRLDTPDGGRLQLSDYRGQAVVLNFWATWCVPCRQEMPQLQAVHAEYVDSGVLTVVGVNLQESPSAVTDFGEELSLTFPLALDRDGEVVRRYGLIGLPGTFFIDAEGVLRARVIGELHGELLSDGVAAALGGEVAAR